MQKKLLITLEILTINTSNTHFSITFFKPVFFKKKLTIFDNRRYLQHTAVILE